MKTQGSHCDILESYIRGLTISLSKSLNDANINVNAIIYENVEGVGTQLQMQLGSLHQIVHHL